MIKAAKQKKGIKKNIFKKSIKHEDCENIIFHYRQMYHLSGYELNKVSSSCFDDKRCIQSDGIKSCSYGHLTQA